MSSKIMIRCDVCTGNYPPEKIKAISTSTTSDEILWLNKPEIDSEHFICHDCLERIGVRFPRKRKAGGHPAI